MEELLKQIQRQQTLFKAISASLKKIDTVDTTDSYAYYFTLIAEGDKLRKAVDGMSGGDSLNAEIQHRIDNFTEVRHTLEEDIRRNFGRELHDNLASADLLLEGNFPDFRVGFLTCTIDLQNGKASISYGQRIVSLERCDTTPAMVADRIIYHYRRIADRPFDELVILQHLFEAYQMSLSRSDRNIGDEVPLPDILPLVALLRQDQKFKRDPRHETFVDYPRELFSYDLSRLKQREVAGYQMKLVTALRGETRDPNGTFWLPPRVGHAQGETISRLRFARVESSHV